MPPHKRDVGQEKNQVGISLFILFRFMRVVKHFPFKQIEDFIEHKNVRDFS